jgi:hypothetical protein
MKSKNKILFIFTILIFSNSYTQDCSEIFISEYVEGSGNDKAIELYNPTSIPINLSGYTIERHSNGASDAIGGGTLILSGVINAYSTFVIVNGQTVPDGTNPVCSPALQAMADLLDGVYPAPTYMNGNDAIVLKKNGILIDIIGKSGDGSIASSDGWSDMFPYDGSAGVVWTENHTLIRKAIVKHGVTSNPDPFIVTTEWDSLQNNIWSNLGSHICDCSNSNPTEITINISSCDNYIAPDNQIYSQSGTYIAIVPDTIFTINFIFQSTFSNVNIFSCANYTAPDNQIYSQSGTYTAVIPNSISCDSIITINLTVISPQSPNLCLVTNINNKNLVVWNEIPEQKAFKYRVYKQNNTTSLYDMIHEQDIDSLSEFLDASTDVSTISRYKLSLVDSCGNEGAISSNHTTILLTSSLGTNDNVNLNWNAYEGFLYPNFEIWRSIDGNTYNMLSTVANNTFSYIDNNPNANSYYQIRVVSPEACTSTRATYGNVTSNIIDKNGNFVNSISENAQNIFKLSPNPATNTVNITFSENLNQEKLSIYSISGQKIHELGINESSIILDITSYSKGLYFIEIGNIREKFIKE